MPPAVFNARANVPRVRIEPTDIAITAWLDGAVNHERRGTFAEIKLERIQRFVRFLPLIPAPCAFVGTKGKGSTVRLSEAALVAGGARTIAFTSPHVHCLRERWRIDGKVANAAIIATHASTVDDLERRHGEILTWFERTFAIACLLAAARPDTHFLLEAGLGGRLDCANALDCRIAVVTHLSHDHRDVLGPTLTHIAREKLAVARAGRPLLIAPQTPAARAAINAELPPGVTPTWIAPLAEPIELALDGAHQQDNAVTALALVAAIAPTITNATARAGMATATLAARCQLLTLGTRRWLIDGAHNGPSIAATIAVAHARLRPGWIVVLGFATDKEADEILAEIPEKTLVLRCGYQSSRARGAAQWPARAQAWPWHERIAEALAALPDCDVCVTGSFYLAGETLVALGVAPHSPEG